ADADAPFALAAHGARKRGAAALRLTLWPGGDSVLLADVDYHGRWLRWRVGPDALAALIDRRH
ncbi:MAG: hypothetical protein HC871_02545, partial [Rhizobiales bacterium]|nr:hypothetical protein [Hyphomicrobiales bacterium]